MAGSKIPHDLTGVACLPDGRVAYPTPAAAWYTVAILFMFYWHNDKFQERYGKQEMTELESALRNTFKAVGDLILFLKKKSIEPDMAVRGSDVDLKPLTS